MCTSCAQFLRRERAALDKHGEDLLGALCRIEHRRRDPWPRSIEDDLPGGDVGGCQVGAPLAEGGEGHHRQSVARSSDGIPDRRAEWPGVAEIGPKKANGPKIFSLTVTLRKGARSALDTHCLCGGVFRREVKDFTCAPD